MAGHAKGLTLNLTHVVRLVVHTETEPHQWTE
jgi:hypothetical protein